MTQIRFGTVVPLLILLLAVVSCDRFSGGSNVAKPTQVVDFPSMVGKSLQEMTTMLGTPTKPASCYHWELPEGELNVCYETSDASKRMSSMSYTLKPELGVGSLEEMMALLKIDVQGKVAEENRRGFSTYNISLNGKSCFVDIHPRATIPIIGPRGPIYTVAQLYIRNPYIYLHSGPDRTGKETIVYEQQTNINLSVGSVMLGDGNWELCTDVNFTGKCKVLTGVGDEYFKNSKNFSGFGLGNTIRSLRPVEKK